MYSNKQAFGLAKIVHMVRQVSENYFMSVKSLGIWKHTRLLATLAFLTNQGSRTEHQQL